MYGKIKIVSIFTTSTENKTKNNNLLCTQNIPSTRGIKMNKAHLFLDVISTIFVIITVGRILHRHCKAVLGVVTHYFKIQKTFTSYDLQVLTSAGTHPSLGHHVPCYQPPFSASDMQSSLSHFSLPVPTLWKAWLFPDGPCLVIQVSACLLPPHRVLPVHSFRSTSPNTPRRSAHLSFSLLPNAKYDLQLSCLGQGSAAFQNGSQRVPLPAAHALVWLSPCECGQALWTCF